MNGHFMSRIVWAVALAVSGACTYAADSSTERTTMPDFCSNRDVNCVIPDGPSPVRVFGAGAGGVVPSLPVGSTSSGGATQVPAVPALSGQVPSLFGEVPALPGQVPTVTTGASTTGATNNTTTSPLETASGSTSSRSGTVTSRSGLAATSSNSGGGGAGRRH